MYPIVWSYINKKGWYGNNSRADKLITTLKIISKKTAYQQMNK